MHHDGGFGPRFFLSQYSRFNLRLAPGAYSARLPWESVCGMPTNLARTQHLVPWPTLTAKQDPAAELAAFLPAELAARREWLRQRRWQGAGWNRWLWLIVL